MKLRRLQRGGLTFWCPGCDRAHSVNSNQNGLRWSFNGDMERPTFEPSILVTTRRSQQESDWKDDICHSFVRDGQIQFLGDCTHALAAQTVPLADWPFAAGTYGGLDDG